MTALAVERRHGSPTGIGATAAAAAGVAFGPSTMLVLSFGSFAAAYEGALGASRSQIMITVTLVTLAVVMIAPVQGLLIDRFGARRVVLFSNAAFASALAVMSALQLTLWSLYAAYVMIAVAGVGLWPTSYLRIVAGWFERRLGLALGVANSGIGVGAAVLPLVAQAVIQHGGWRYAIGSFALIAAVLLPVNWLLLRDRPAPPVPADAAPAAPLQSAGFWTMLGRSASLRWLVLAYFLIGIPTTGLIITQAAMLSDRGESGADVAIAQMVFGISLMVARIVVGYALDHLKATSIMIATTAGAAVAVLILASGTGGPLLLVAVALLGLALGAEFDVAAYLVKRLMPLDQFGRSYALIYSAFQLAAAIGAPLLALTFESFETYTPALVAYLGCFSLAIICFAARIGRSAGEA